MQARLALKHWGDITRGQKGTSHAKMTLILQECESSFDLFHTNGHFTTRKIQFVPETEFINELSVNKKIKNNGVLHCGVFIEVILK